MRRIIWFMVIVVLCSFAYASFPDADRDGIQDSNDLCARSNTDQVDSHGCSCAQKLIVNCQGVWCCESGQYCIDAQCKSSLETESDEGYVEFSFIVYGDVEKNEKANKKHRELVKRMLTYQPDIIFQTGDIVRFDSWDSHWETFFDIIDPIFDAGLPYYVSRGDAEDGDAWDDYMDWLPGNHHYYTVEQENTLFVVLDTVKDFERGSDQYAWLENTLKNNDKEWVFMFTHFPFYNEGYHKDG